MNLLPYTERWQRADVFVLTYTGPYTRTHTHMNSNEQSPTTMNKDDENYE